MNEIRDIHNPFRAWLDQRGIPFHRNRPDKKTTAIKGDPDFLLTWCSYCVYIECKVPGGKLSEDQEKRIAYLRKAGNKVIIAHSLQDCMEAAQSILCREQQEKASTEPHEPVSGHSDGKRKPKFESRFGEKEEQPESVDRKGQMEAKAESAPKPYIADWGGKPCVFEPSPHAWSGRFLRLATQSDLLHIPRR